MFPLHCCQIFIGGNSETTHSALNVHVVIIVSYWNISEGPMSSIGMLIVMCLCPLMNCY